jgi:hypothetical protein
VSETRPRTTTVVRRFLDVQQQRDWMQGRTILRDTDERADTPELRFKYVARFEKLLRCPQAQEVLEILRRYGRDCIPISRKTERHYWSGACVYRIAVAPEVVSRPKARTKPSVAVLPFDNMSGDPQQQHSATGSPKT